MELRSALVSWYRAHQRDLPWRRQRDPYAVWISEIMLQQTRVDTVIPYYERFLAAWPSVEALAAADPEAVRAAWSGLGYYRRAELMLRAARQIVADHGGRLPATAEGLRALPGFGAYTAGAVASIAYDAPVPAVDGNVLRVLARVGAIEGDTTRGPPRAEVERLAAELARGGAGSAGEWTQALMELGATVCTPRAPRCGSCPIAGACAARAADRVHLIPPARRRAARSRIALGALVVVDARVQHVWLEQRPAGGLFAELWTPPLFEAEGEDHAAAESRARAAGAADPAMVAQVTHTLTHRDLELTVWRAAARRPVGLRKVALDALGEVGLPSIAAKILRAGLPREALSRARLPGRTTQQSRAQLTLLDE